MTKVTHFHIKTLSNLHVGSGEQNFGVVDNLVQRDPITEVPIINSSSLKGAMRDHFETVLECKMTENPMKRIFGDSEQVGEVKFLQSTLLTLPVRSNTQMYFLATTPQILEEYIETHKLLKKEEIKIETPQIGDGLYISTTDENCWVEDYKADSSKAKELQEISEKLFEGHPIALMSHETFKTISLPIITRNMIANTENDDNTLFYEEVIPRHTLFSTYIITPSDIDQSDKSLENGFNKFIDDIKESIIQVGANASIGYGLCQFKEV
jgi:CRISPR-associated protein Cmr4